MVSIDTTRRQFLALPRAGKRNGAAASPVTGQLTDGERTYFLSAGAEEVADLTAGREWLSVYIPGAGVDERVAQFTRDAGTGNWSLNYIHADRQNSVTARSNQWGTLLWPRRAYGAYGGEAETRSIGPRRGRTRRRRWRATSSATPAGAGVSRRRGPVDLGDDERAGALLLPGAVVW